MNNSDIGNQRLHNQHLVGELLNDPLEVVKSLTAIQSQDFAGAKWAVAQRTRNATDADITKLFNDGKILRTHVLRPTWHFVTPADIRWMLQLTAPRVHAGNAYYYRKFELDDEIFRKSESLFIDALQGGKQLMRREMVALLEAAGIEASGLRLGYILMSAELNGIICSGALNGKQHTYALLEERVPAVKPLSRTEALAELATRYFTSHGPAQVQDFVWWSGLTTTDAKKAIVQASVHLVEGNNYWMGRASSAADPGVTAHLLPNYDEYMIAYKDRSVLAETSRDMLPAPAGIFDRHITVLNGKVVGAWRAEKAARKLVISTTLLLTPTATEQDALWAAVHRYGDFIGESAELEQND